MASFGWSDTTKTSDSGFQLLEPGVYDFTVTDFERGRFRGSSKIGPCDKAVYTCHVTDGEGRATDLKAQLFLDDSMLWKITQFFKCVGLIDPATPSGTDVTFPWDEARGRSGRLEVSLRDWTGDDGKARQSNDIARFVVPEPKADYGAL